MKLTKSILAAAVLSAVAFSASAADKVGHSRAVQTTVAQAKTLVADYDDGTNVLFANWSHRTVIVDIPAMDQTITLGPIGTHSSVYLAQDEDYFSSVGYTIETVSGDVIAYGTAFNPATVEIRDNDSSAHATAQATTKGKLQITVKHGI